MLIISRNERIFANEKPLPANQSKISAKNPANQKVVRSCFNENKSKYAGYRQLPLCGLAARKPLALQAVFGQQVLRKASYIFLAE